MRGFDGQADRPDLAACVASGLFDICVEIVVVFAAAGLDGLRDTNHGILVQRQAGARLARQVWDSAWLRIQDPWRSLCLRWDFAWRTRWI